MSQENNLALSKQQISDFVDDALAMEVKIYSLRELSTKLNNKARMLKSEASQKWVASENRFRKESGMSNQEIKIRQEIADTNAKITKIQNSLDEETKYELSMIGSGPVISSLILTAVIGAILMVIANFAIIGAVYLSNPELAGRLYDSNLVMSVLMVFLFIALGITLKSANAKKAKKAKKRAIASLEKRTQPLKERIAQLENELNNPRITSSRLTFDKLEHIKNSCEKDRKNASELEREAIECYDKANEIQEILMQCYEKSNIVPPDYRYIDCLVVLQHAFRNGLADNMKEAVLYYEQKEFRNEVIRGVNSIHEMLGNLASTMAEVRGVLTSIDQNVNTIMRNQETSINIESARMYAEKEFHEAQIAHNKWVEKTFSSYEY